MRIAQMIDSLDWGGAQKMQLFLVQALRSVGIDITIISLSDHADSHIPQLLRDEGARVVSFPFPKLLRPNSFFQLTRFLAVEKFDLVQAYLSYSNIVGSLAGVLTKTPVIASLRNAGYDPKIYSKKRAVIEQFCLRFVSTRVMANGYKVADYWLPRLNNRQIDVVVNAVDPILPISSDERMALRTEIMGDPNRPLVLSVGRLTPQKGYFDLIHAFARVCSIQPNAALAIAGRGRLFEPLSQLVSQLGLQENVFMLGIRNDVHRLMGAADVYVNSSHWEGTPVSVLEAMAAGLPVVATAVGETSYLLQNNAGIVVPASQPEMLADGIQTILASSEIRGSFSKVARDRIYSEYTREAWKWNILSLYSQVSPRAKEYLRNSAPVGISLGGVK